VRIARADTTPLAGFEAAYVRAGRLRAGGELVHIRLTGEGAVMSRSLAQKMGVNEGVRAYFENVPASLQDTLRLPHVQESVELAGQFDYLHFFTTSQAEMDERFPVLKSHLEPAGMLWVSWPKGKRNGTDLSLPEVIRIGYSHGLVESICLSVDDTWSGLKFTHPKAGKVYRNRYGRLPAYVRTRE
jgi:hypothetical protein